MEKYSFWTIYFHVHNSSKATGKICYWHLDKNNIEMDNGDCQELFLYYIYLGINTHA